MRGIPLLLLLAAAACTGREDPPAEKDSGEPPPGPENGDTQAPADSGDTADSGHAVGPYLGVTEPVQDELAYDHLDDGRQVHVVRVADDEGAALAVAIVHPNEYTASRYEEGAPVLLTSYGALTNKGKCSEESPPPSFSSDLGSVTLQVLNTASCCRGVCSDGDLDMGGEYTQRGIAALFEFAAGERTCTLGYDLATITGRPLRQDRVALLGSSSSALTLLAAVARRPDRFEALAAIALYESPFLPMMTSRGLGAVQCDDDHDTDSDGNGIGWDDMRNVRYEPGDCGTEGCLDLDLEGIAWDPDLAMVDYGMGGVPDTAVTPGVLYYDGNGNGALDLDPEDGNPDTSGDDALSASEDFVFIGTFDSSQLGTDRYWHAVELLQAALDHGALEAGDWPSHFGDVEETRAFWEDRDPQAAMATIVGHFPDLPWLVLANAADHGVAQATRPHVVLQYQVLQDLGAEVYFEPTPEAVLELFDEEAAAFDRLEEGAALTEENVQDHLLPDGLSGEGVRAAGAVEMLRWTWESSR